jgi:hypothetical protein
MPVTEKEKSSLTFSCTQDKTKTTTTKSLYKWTSKLQGSYKFHSAGIKEEAETQRKRLRWYHVFLLNS